MKRVTKEQVDNLIKNGYLKNKKGRYPDLQITSRQRTRKRKNYFVPDYLMEKLKGVEV